MLVVFSYSMATTLIFYGCWPSLSSTHRKSLFLNKIQLKKLGGEIMNLTLNTILKLYPVSIKKDKKNYIIEDTISGDFYEMPKICVDAIEFINQKWTLGQIEAELKRLYPDEEVDVINFAKQLIDFRLVKEIDGIELKVEKSNLLMSGFSWISPRFSRLFFHKHSNMIFICLIMINLLLFLTNTELIPYYEDLFLFDSLVLNMVTFSLISLVMLVIHEFGHVLAARSFDLPAKLGVGHRFFLVVFETDLTYAWRLSPKERNTLYIAGLYFEQFILFIVLLIKLFITVRDPILSGILNFIILDLFYKAIYQCCFFMKTDIYYIFENSSGCYNLLENSRTYLRQLFSTSRDKGQELFENETRIVKVYSIFYIIGGMLMITLLIFYIIPQMYTFLKQAIMNLVNPVDPTNIIDSVLFLGLFFITSSLLLYSLIKENRRIPSS